MIAIKIYLMILQVSKIGNKLVFKSLFVIPQESEQLKSFLS